MPPAPDWGWKDDHPIVNVNWNDAQAYCKWAEVRLPTEAQWEKAAHGLTGLKRLFYLPDVYPWGNTFDRSKLWCSKTAVADAGGTHRVGELGISPYGCTDMAGNAQQWCEDWYDPDFWDTREAKRADPVNLDVGRKLFRVTRGGSWWEWGELSFRASHRDWSLPYYRRIFCGFRCAAM
jgi:formylglycine-generating enzyme required for sulfatase activity